MKLRSLLIGASVSLVVAAPLEGQFSTDIPGVPRASVPFRGGHQNRTTWNFSYLQQENNVLAGTAEGDTRTFGAGLEFGQSFRIGSRWEIGYDLGLLEGQYTRPPSDDTQTGGVLGEPPNSIKGGSVLHSLRAGLKFRPLYALSPEGYGYEAAVGASFQPSLEPVFGFMAVGDSTQMGGLAGSGDEEEATILFPAAPQSTQFAGMFSYRARRFLVDAALIYTKISADDEFLGSSSSLEDLSGFHPRIGGMFRVLPSFGIGASWWGSGSPPWSNQFHSIGVDEKKSSFAPFLSFGSKPESGVDLLVSSPTGDFTESVRVYIRGRSTR